MEDTTSREKVLKKIRNALINKVENPYPSLDTESPIYHEFTDNIDIIFAQEFTKVAGKFVYCENENDLRQKLQILVTEKKWKSVFCTEPRIIDLLTKCRIDSVSDPDKLTESKVSVTFCEFLIARLGSIMVSSGQVSGRRSNVYPETHIVLANSRQIVPELKDALKKLKEKYNNNLPSMVTVITGPSRTADIEKTLVMGAHGPKELYVFLMDEE